MIGTYVKQAPIQENEYLIYVGASFLQFEPDICGLVFRHLFSEAASGKLLTALTPLTELADIYLSTGFTRLPWTDSVYTNGTHALAFQLDLRESNLVRSINGVGVEQEVPDSISYQSITPHIKK